MLWAENQGQKNAHLQGVSEPKFKTGPPTHSRKRITLTSNLSYLRKTGTENSYLIGILRTDVLEEEDIGEGIKISGARHLTRNEWGRLGGQWHLPAGVRRGVRWGRGSAGQAVRTAVRTAWEGKAGPSRALLQCWSGSPEFFVAVKPRAGDHTSAMPRGSTSMNHDHDRAHCQRCLRTQGVMCVWDLSTELGTPTGLTVICAVTAEK